MNFKAKHIGSTAFLLLIALGVYWLVDAQSRQDDARQAHDEPFPPSHSSFTSTKEPGPGSTTKSISRNPLDIRASEEVTEKAKPTKAETYDTKSVEEDFAEAFKAFPYLKRNYVFSSKAILSDHEAGEWDKLLSSPKNISNTLEGIKSHYNPDYDVQFSTVNQERIRFLKYASQLRNNPSSSMLFEGIEENLLWFPEDIAALPSDQKRSLVGDKAELIYIYEAFRPDGASRLDEMAELNLKFRRVLKYARANASHLNRLL